VLVLKFEKCSLTGNACAQDLMSCISIFTKNK